MLSSLDVQEMKRIAQDSYTAAVERAFSQPGGVALRDLLEFLLVLYAHVEPETISGTLYVTRRVDDESRLDDLIQGASSRSFRQVDRLPRSITGVTVIDVQDGVYRVWENVTFDAAAASSAAIVYRYMDREEVFVINASTHRVRNPAPIHASVFSRPTFSSVREALLDYRETMVRTSFCFLLREVWEDETRRLFLRPKPEWIMRRSLHQFLRSSLRDASVRPEQVVDESHPVDLKVIFTPTTREAIIEIKWLGKSRRGRRVTASHTDRRARDGAKQLADYLDATKQAAPDRQSRGYYVIIDARRQNLKPNTITLSRADGMFFEQQEIRFNPEYHRIRDDYDPPIRMFVEPV